MGEGRVLQTVMYALKQYLIPSTVSLLAMICGSMHRDVEVGIASFTITSIDPLVKILLFASPNSYYGSLEVLVPEERLLLSRGKMNFLLINPSALS